MGKRADSRSSKVKHRVEAGRIVVDNVYCVYRTARVMLVYVDCASKYPEVDGVMLDCDSNVETLFLRATRHTLGADRSRKWPTGISFAPGWQIWCSEFAGKYTVAVTLFRTGKDHRPKKRRGSS